MTEAAAESAAPAAIAREWVALTAAADAGLPWPITSKGRAFGLPLCLSGDYFSCNASRAPNVTKAPAKARRIQAMMAGRETTWSRMAAAKSP